MAKVKYLSNANLLLEIHKSKNSFCSFLDTEYSDYDVIVKDLVEVTPEFLLVHNKPSLVIRVMNSDHIPRDPNPPKRKKDDRVRTIFSPFRHYVVREDTSLVEVGRSHWTGGLGNGYFEQTQGRMTNDLGKMFMLLVERYGHRASWRGYSYRSEMEGQAIMQLTQVGLQFDESKSNNPFGFYTAVIANSFRRIFHMEKRHQMIRDDVLIMHGQKPSYTRQTEDQHRVGTQQESGSFGDDGENGKMRM